MGSSPGQGDLLITAQSLWICTVEPFQMVRAAAQLQSLLGLISVYSEVVPEKQELGVAGWFRLEGTS